MTLHVCPPDHKHDQTGTCYHHHHCRCTPCVTHSNAETRHVRKLQAYGRWQPFVSAARARNHIRVLSGRGVGHRRVAELSGVGEASIRKIAAGDTTRIRPATSSKICAIPVDASALAPGSFVPARGAQRRLQALHARGWSTGALAPHLGIYQNNVARILRHNHITLRMHNRIADVYEQLWNEQPTNDTHSQNRELDRARRNDWHPPLAWDDIDNDDAPADGEEIAVDEVAVQLVVDEGAYVPLTRAERHLAVITLNGRRYNDQEIAHMLRVDARTILRDRQKLGLPAHPEPYEERFAA